MSSVPCGYSKCRRKVPVGEGIFDDGVWYHERCYYTMIRQECSKLEQKAQAKSITLEEFERYQDIKPLVDRVHKEIIKPHEPSINDLLSYGKTPIFEGRSNGIKNIESIQQHQISHPIKQHQLESPRIKLSVEESRVWYEILGMIL